MHSKKLIVAVALCASLLSHTAWANQIVLEGSDATTFHGEVTYSAQLFTFMQHSTTLPVLILGGVAIGGPAPSQMALAPDYDLSGYLIGTATTLADYSGIYIESPGGCCLDASGFISPADAAMIGAAEASMDLSVTIQDYGGGPAWAMILPAAVNALPPTDFGGLTTYGTAGGPGCTDLEVVNAQGLAKGFTQPPVLGCYEHQGYRTAAFTALGFLSLIDADPAYFGPDGLGSALLALGGELGTPVPEPASLMLLGVGLLGLRGVIRRRRQQA